MTQGLWRKRCKPQAFDVRRLRATLDQDSLRRGRFAIFTRRRSSPDRTPLAFIYMGGYGLQLEGENYFVPVDARICQRH